MSHKVVSGLHLTWPYSQIDAVLVYEDAWLGIIKTGLMVYDKNLTPKMRQKSHLKWNTRPLKGEIFVSRLTQKSVNF